MISSLSARPPLVTTPSIPFLCHFMMLFDPMLRDSPSSAASMTRMEPGNNI
jgi:hypothetical protein